jgi:hypothetical protein
LIIRNAVKKANQETAQTELMVDVMKKRINDQPVTPHETKVMRDQFRDLVSYGVIALGSVLAAASAGPLAGAGIALTALYKKELIDLIRNQGPEVIINLLKTRGNIDIIDQLAHKFVHRNVAEGSENNTTAQKIFFARSNIAPKGWSYDHVGFITQDGKQIQMSGHRGNDVYVTNDVTDDPAFPKQNIKIVSLSKPVSVPTTNSVGAENCGTFVANVLKSNGIKGIDTEKLYSVMKKPREQGVAEDTGDKNPQWLYHATYRPLLKSIKAHGLGGDQAQAKWEDSKPGVVYLALDPNVAESYAESSDVVPEDWLDQIVILKIAAGKLDKSRLFVDQNVQDNEGDTLEYHGVISLSNISLYKKGVSENFADGRNPGRKGLAKRVGVNCKQSVTKLRSIAKKSSGERQRMAHWCANMKSGKKKK